MPRYPIAARRWNWSASAVGFLMRWRLPFIAARMALAVALARTQPRHVQEHVEPRPQHHAEDPAEPARPRRLRRADDPVHERGDHAIVEQQQSDRAGLLPQGE